MAMLEAIADLEVRLQALAAVARPLREQMSRNDKERSRLQAEKKRLEDMLAASRDQITVSDHAVIRYLERRYGFDFEDVRTEILSPAVRRAVNAGAAGVKVTGGTFKIQDRTITTFFSGKEERER
jgi:hypothetical protein